MDKLLLIIPAFNECKNLPNLITNINKTKFPETLQVDILIINDFSTDNTEELLKKISNIKFINLPCNLGIGGAVQTGYKYAKRNNYDYAIQLDGDGQHNPEYIVNLYNEIKNNKNFVIGSRFIENEGFQSSKLRRVGISFFYHLIKFLTGKKITDATSGFRMADKKVISIFASSYPIDFPEPETTIKLIALDLKISEIPVVMNDRKHGVSSINLPKSIYYMIKVTLAILFAKFSTKKEGIIFE
ncbi:MAG: glycosyltransferase family 2 protein [Sarcina sp.]